MKFPTIKVFVEHLSLTSMQEAGFDLDDGGKQEKEIFSGFYKESLLGFLTRKQRRLAECLNDRGMTRKEAAECLGVSLQAVHQMVLRMRKRLIERAGLKVNGKTKN